MAYEKIDCKMCDEEIELWITIADANYYEEDGECDNCGLKFKYTSPPGEGIVDIKWEKSVK
jgi:transcription elongation factor Elf1